MLFKDFNIFLIAFRRFGKKLNFWDIKLIFLDFVRFAQNVKRSETPYQNAENVCTLST